MFYFCCRDFTNKFTISSGNNIYDREIYRHKYTLEYFHNSWKIYQGIYKGIFSFLIWIAIKAKTCLIRDFDDHIYFLLWSYLLSLSICLILPVILPVENDIQEGYTRAKIYYNILQLKWRMTDYTKCPFYNKAMEPCTEGCLSEKSLRRALCWTFGEFSLIWINSPVN